MIVFPNCKINLGLRITGKRADGYHNIETIFFPLPFKDALELNIAAKHGSDDLELNVMGAPVPGDLHTNLCYKAWELIKKDFPDIGPARMHLLKAIPIGAGLGGGSSDAAHALLLLDHEFQLSLTREQLLGYAFQLGSDCPFFIVNKPCFATGRGEIMEETGLDLSRYCFVLVNPEVHISTAWAFGKITPGNRDGIRPLKEIVTLPLEQWRDQLINDFEKPVFAEYESLKIIKDDLYTAGAVYASMTGSGSCIFGIFHLGYEPDLSRIIKHYKVYQFNRGR